MVVVTYLDTWAVRGIVSDKAKDRQDLARLFALLRLGVYIVKVSQAVIGEAVATMLRDYGPGVCEDKVAKALQAIRDVADPATCLPPPTQKVAETAMRILAHVRGIGWTDAVIVAQALLDPESQKFVTRDALLTNSQWLVEEERRMRENGERTKRLKFVDEV